MKKKLLELIIRRMEKIKIYGKQGCVPCATLKQMLTDKQVEFEYVDIMTAMEEVGKLGIRQVPTTIVTDDQGNELKRVVGAKLEEIL